MSHDDDEAAKGIALGEGGALAAPPDAGEPSDRPLIGIALMVAAMTVVPFMDAIAKYLSSYYPTTQIVWSRFFFHFVILAPIVLYRYGPVALKPSQPALQLVRGGFLLTATIFFFGAIATIPIADALALLFVSPMIVTALSPLLLGERVGIRRWLATVVGFCGALIVLRPGFVAVEAASLWALGAGCAYALYSIATRKLAGSAPPLVTLAYTAVLGMVVMSVAVVPEWITPPPQHLAMMFGVGVVAAAGHFLLIRAFEYAAASLLAPYSYTEIVTATALGYYVFGDFPDGWTWLGIATIIASGIYISWREGQKSAR